MGREMRLTPWFVTQELATLDEELLREEVRVEQGGALTIEEKTEVYNAVIASEALLGENSGRVWPTFKQTRPEQASSLICAFPVRDESALENPNVPVPRFAPHTFGPVFDSSTRPPMREPSGTPRI